MEFKVVFKNADGKPIIENPPGEVGLDMVDFLREKLELTEMELPVEKIDGAVRCNLSYYSHSVILTEFMVRGLSLFRGRNQVRVSIPEYFLTKFQKFHIEKHWRDQGLFADLFKRPKVLHYVTATLTILDDNFLLTEWIKAGCPLQWGTES